MDNHHWSGMQVVPFSATVTSRYDDKNFGVVNTTVLIIDDEPTPTLSLPPVITITEGQSITVTPEITPQIAPDIPWTIIGKGVDSTGNIEFGYQEDGGVVGTMVETQVYTLALLQEGAFKTITTTTMVIRRLDNDKATLSHSCAAEFREGVVLQCTLTSTKPISRNVKVEIEIGNHPEGIQGTSFELPALNLTQSFTIPIPGDDIYRGNYTITTSIGEVLQSGVQPEGTVLGTLAVVTTTVVDNDSGAIAITAPGDVYSGQQFAIGITATQVPVGDSTHGFIQIPGINGPDRKFSLMETTKVTETFLAPVVTETTLTQIQAFVFGLTSGHPGIVTATRPITIHPLTEVLVSFESPTSTAKANEAFTVTLVTSPTPTMTGDRCDHV